MFEPRFRFVHNNKASRDYLRVRAAVRDGFNKLPRRTGSKYRVSTPTNEGFPRTARDAQRRVRQLLKTRPVGTEVKVVEERPNGDVIDKTRFRKTRSTAPIKPTPGNEFLDRVEGYIESEFARARWAGDCVCKPNSDHAGCKAVDYFDSETNMMKMRSFLLTHADYFGIKYIILFDRIWYPDGNSYNYTGDYHAHIHVSVNGGWISAC